MKTTHKNILIIFGLVAMIGILASQVIWLHDSFTIAYQQERKKVNTALTKTIHQIINVDTLNSGYSKPSHGTDQFNKALTDSLLKENIQDLALEKPVYYSIINTQTNDIVSSNLPEGSRTPEGTFSKDFPKDHYKLILFSEIKMSGAFRQVKFWVITSLAFIVIMFYAFFSTAAILKKEKKKTREKMDLIYNLIHEYKTPLATIQTASELLLSQRQNTKTPLSLKYLKIISEENTRLQKLIEKQLGLTVIDRADLSLNFEKTDLHDLIDEAIKSLHIQLEQTNGKIEKHFIATNSIIYADTVHMVHVITNIVENSIKYCKEKPNINISTNNDTKDKIHMEICDYGYGIPAEHQKNIFTQFYRSPEHKKTGKSGFGLGLYYVKKMVAQHKGSISFQSLPEQGTCFSVYLPVTK
ncbi:MAG: HAMP domain-containing sensor histidine kinase [Bacteroidales bacterium]